MDYEKEIRELKEEICVLKNRLDAVTKAQIVISEQFKTPIKAIEPELKKVTLKNRK